VTINPSIDPDELFPGVNHFNQYENHLNELICYFDDRFCPVPSMNPLPYGRSEGRVSIWRRDVGGPTPRYQQTWGQIDNVLRECVAGTARDGCDAPLGDIAAIVDAVPWKFARWACVLPEWKRELLQLGSPYLAHSLEAHPECPPAAVIACALDRKLLQEGHKLASTKDGLISINGRSVPFFEVSAPTAYGGAFLREFRKIASAVRGALGY